MAQSIAKGNTKATCFARFARWPSGRSLGSLGEGQGVTRAEPLARLARRVGLARSARSEPGAPSLVPSDRSLGSLAMSFPQKTKNGRGTEELARSLVPERPLGSLERHFGACSFAQLERAELLLLRADFRSRALERLSLIHI